MGVEKVEIILLGTNFSLKSKLAKILEEAGFWVFTTFYTESVLERLRTARRITWVVVLDDEACDDDPEASASLLKRSCPEHARLIRVYTSGEPPVKPFGFDLALSLNLETEAGELEEQEFLRILDKFAAQLKTV